MTAKTKSPAPTLADIIDEVCKYFDVDPESLFSRTRKQPIALARQFTMYIAYELGGCSRSSLAEDFDRTWGSVYRSIQAVEHLLQGDTPDRNSLIKIASAATKKARNQNLST